MAGLPRRIIKVTAWASRLCLPCRRTAQRGPSLSNAARGRRPEAARRGFGRGGEGSRVCWGGAPWGDFRPQWGNSGGGDRGPPGGSPGERGRPGPLLGRGWGCGVVTLVLARGPPRPLRPPQSRGRGARGNRGGA